MGCISVCMASKGRLFDIKIGFNGGGNPSWRSILYSLECPRTFIFGEKSLPDPDIQVLAEQGIQIEIVKDAGHSMAWENPEGLASAVSNGIQYAK